jgi:hypothetical protein
VRGVFISTDSMASRTNSIAIDREASDQIPRLPSSAVTLIINQWWGMSATVIGLGQTEFIRVSKWTT